jgi:hypothetical protein
MANNRMWLIHKPSKLGVMLGKRMSCGWYTSDDNLMKFFDYIQRCEGQDDFVLAMEDCFGEWDYTDEREGGFMKFTLK